VQYPFAAVAHLIVFGDLPAAARLKEFEDFLWEAGRLPADLADTLAQLSRLGGHPMATLQAAMPLMADNAAAGKMGVPVTSRKRWWLPPACPLPRHAVGAAFRKNPGPYPATRRYGERFLQLLHDRTPTEQWSAF